MGLSSAATAAARFLLPAPVRRFVRSIQRGAEARRRSADLVALATFFRTDKWGSHWYAQHYQSHLARFRDQPITLLEIGIGGYDAPDRGGESLRMWKAFFPKAQVVGIDIFDKRAIEEDRIRVFQGSQDDPAFLNDVVAHIGRPDVIIDDGSHLNAHVLASFAILFPHLKNGGVYVIEDSQTSYWPTWGGAATERNSEQTSMGFVKALVDGLNHVEFLIPGYSPSYYERNIVGLHFYHNLVIIDKGPNDEQSNLVVDGELRD